MYATAHGCIIRFRGSEDVKDGTSIASSLKLKLRLWWTDYEKQWGIWVG